MEVRKACKLPWVTRFSYPSKGSTAWVAGFIMFIFSWKIILMTALFLYHLEQFSIIFHCQRNPGHSLKNNKRGRK